MIPSFIPFDAIEIGLITLFTYALISILGKGIIEWITVKLFYKK